MFRGELLNFQRVSVPASACFSSPAVACETWAKMGRTSYLTKRCQINHWVDFRMCIFWKRIGSIHQKLNRTESQRTLPSKLLEILDTQVQGSVQWVLLEISWNQPCKQWQIFLLIFSGSIQVSQVAKISDDFFNNSNNNNAYMQMNTTIYINIPIYIYTHIVWCQYNLINLEV